MLWVLLATGKRGLLEIIKHALVGHVERAHEACGIADNHLGVNVTIEALEKVCLKIFAQFPWAAYYTDVLSFAFIYHRHADGIPERNHNPKPFSLALHPGQNPINKIKGSRL